MQVKQPVILAGGAALALTIGIGFGFLAVAPVSKAVAHAPGLTAKVDLLPAAEAQLPAATPPTSRPIAAAAYPEPVLVPRARNTQEVQYAQQAARDDLADVAWPDEKVAPAPRDEPQDVDEDGPREMPSRPPPPPYAYGPPGGYGPPGPEQP
jgi:hypothetical protein